MKVLISAYACEPGKGSEPGIGWNWAMQAARYHDVWVLTRSNNRSAINAALREAPVPNLSFIYHDLPACARFWKRGDKGANLYYLLWQATALIPLLHRHRLEKFDVAHHVTIGSIRFFSPLACLGIPFVWGPVGGAERAPTRFYRTFGVVGLLHELSRDLSNSLIRISPAVQYTMRRAERIILSTPESIRALPKRERAKAIVHPAIGAQEISVPSEKKTYKAQRLQALYVGRLLHWKGVHLAIRAVAAASRAGTSVSLTIVGTGPFSPDLKQLVERLGVQQHVQFLGNAPRSEVMKLYGDHDCFLFPSLHDTGGFAVLEAMLAGLPVLCLDLGGPAMTVTDRTGIKIPATSPRRTVAELARAVEWLAANPEARQEMGKAGRSRALETYSWDRLGDYLHSLYAHVK